MNVHKNPWMIVSLLFLFVSILLPLIGLKEEPRHFSSDESCNILSLSGIDSADVTIKTVHGWGTRSVADGNLARVIYNNNECVIEVPAFGDPEQIMKGNFDVVVTSKWNHHNIPTTVAVIAK